MTTEERIDKLERQVLGLQALSMIQTAETNSLLALLRQMVTNHDARAGQPSAASVLENEYMLLRQERLRIALLLQEQTNPALAARLSDLMDRPGLNFPVKFDE